MAVGKVHRWACKRLWAMQCPSPRCPCSILDSSTIKANDKEDWHGKHNRLRGAIFIFSERDDKPPSCRRCMDWINATIKGMEPFFDEFCSNLPSLSRLQVLRCWAAHLAVDCACPYWCDGTGLQVDEDYGKIRPDEFWYRFLMPVGRNVLDSVPAFLASLDEKKRNDSETCVGGKEG